MDWARYFKYRRQGMALHTYTNAETQKELDDKVKIFTWKILGSSKVDNNSY